MKAQFRARARCTCRLVAFACLIEPLACGKVVHIGTRTEVSEDTSAGEPSLDAGEAIAVPATPAPEAANPPAPADAGPVIILPPRDAAAVELTPKATCDGAGRSIGNLWSFDSSLGDWQQSSVPEASLTWSDAEGAGAPGAVRVESADTGSDGVFLFISTELQDLNGKLLTAQILLDSAVEVSAKLFAQSGTDYAWADGGEVHLPPGEWTCLALALGDPAFAVGSFDASRVRRMGIQLRGPSIRVYVDDIAY